jgi:hypothetical protein
MVRPPENVLIVPRLFILIKPALLRDIESASSPVLERKVVVTTSDKLGKATSVSSVHVERNSAIAALM